MRNRHALYYFFETLILGFGFFIMFLTETVYYQTLELSALVLIYISLGVIHHKLTHDINFKIVLEYVLIGAFVFSVFLLFKSGVI